MWGSSALGFALTRTALLVAVLALTILSIGTFVWSSALTGTSGAIVSAIASTFLSLAVAIFITEIALKPIYTHDILQLIGLRQRLHDIGLIDVTRENGADWEALYDGCAHLRALILLHPAVWRNNQLPLVMGAAKSRKVEVDLYLIDPDSSALAIVAGNLGLEPSAYRQEVLETAEDVESTWKAARGRHTLHAASTLTIHYVDAVVQQSVTSFDGHSILVLPPTTPERAAWHLALQFNASARSEATEWLEDRWRVIEDHLNSAPKYTDQRPSTDLRAGKTHEP